MQPRIPRLVMAAPMVAALAATLAASGAPMGRTETPALTSISSRLDGAVSTVLIEATAPVAYLTSQPDPLTVFVDLRNVDTGGVAAGPLSHTLPPVAGVEIEKATSPDGSPVARVRVSLDRAAKHRVRSARNVILVEVERAGAVGAAGASGASSATGASSAAGSVAASPRLLNNASASTSPAVVARVNARAAATELRSLKTEEVSNGYAITLSGNGALVASSVADATDLPHRVLLDFRDVAMGRVAPVTTVQHTDIERVRVATNSRDPLITRVVIDLARKIPYTLETVGEELRVLFFRAPRPSDDLTRSGPPDAARGAQAPEPANTGAPSAPTPARAPEVTAMVAAMTALVPAPVQPAPAQPVPVAAVVPRPADDAARSLQTLLLAAAPASAAAAAAPSGQAPVQPATAALLAQATPPVPQAPAAPTPNPVLLGAAQGPRQFTGDPVTLDFQGADLRAVLRTFAEISGLNMVIDPSINGTVDVSLRDVPWDQALDIILRANKLGYSVDGTIVRVVPLTVLSQEREEQRKLTEATALVGDLRVLTRPLSYAKAADLVPIVTRSSLSTRGDVQIDARTNTLIIRDLADRLTSAAELITALDRPQPQVEIEARIVQTTRAFARNLGVQWGFNGRVDPSVGTSTGLTFPNTGAATATTGGDPIQGANTALGIALGSINGALNLDVALTALERTGKGRLLSTPRVSTQNNVEAEITQGVQIPIQTVSNNTVTVSFKDAALTLRVTPQITASNTVIMRIFMENATANFAQSVNGIPPIDTQRAVTTVLVADGDTTVIGGIYVSNEQSTEGRTPFLYRIPLLGWLFKRDETSEDSRELLIFITPRLMK